MYVLCRSKNLWYDTYNNDKNKGSRGWQMPHSSCFQAILGMKLPEKKKLSRKVSIFFLWSKLFVRLQKNGGVKHKRPEHWTQHLVLNFSPLSSYRRYLSSLFTTMIELRSLRKMHNCVKIWLAGSIFKKCTLVFRINYLFLFCFELSETFWQFGSAVSVA